MCKAVVFDVKDLPDLLVFKKEVDNLFFLNILVVIWVYFVINPIDYHLLVFLLLLMIHTLH